MRLVVDLGYELVSSRLLDDEIDIIEAHESYSNGYYGSFIRHAVTYTSATSLGGAAQGQQPCRSISLAYMYQVYQDHGGGGAVSTLEKRGVKDPVVAYACIRLSVPLGAASWPTNLEGVSAAAQAYMHTAGQLNLHCPYEGDAYVAGLHGSGQSSYQGALHYGQSVTLITLHVAKHEPCPLLSCASI